MEKEDEIKSGTHEFKLDSKGNTVITQNLVSDVKDIRDTFDEKHPIPTFKIEGTTFQDFIKEIEDSGMKIEYNKKLNNSNTIVQYYFPEKKVGFNYYSMIEASETLGGKKKGWMAKEYDDCIAEDIHLIQVLEEEFVLHKDVLLDKLKHQLGLLKTEIIFARKCEIKEISNEEKNEFCEKYHIQGKDSSKVRLGLFYNGKLVAVQTYAAKRLCMGIKDKKRVPNEYELIRFCIDTHYTITGAFGKLQHYFIEKYKPTEITTFADLRYTDERSSIYMKNGYIFDHKTEANYFYFNYAAGEIKKYHRFNFRKTEVLKRFSPNCSEKMTEYENCLYNGWDRIWVGENILFVLKPQKNNKNKV